MVLIAADQRDCTNCIVRVVNSATGALRCTVAGQDPILHTDGEVLARLNATGVWDAKTGVPITPWLRHRPYGKIESIDLSPDGRELLTASAETVLVWRLPEIEFTPDDLLSLSRFLALRAVDSTGNLSTIQTEPKETLLSTTVEAIRSKIPQAPLPVVARMEPRQQEKDWQRLKSRYPDFFTPSKERTANWHRLEALRLMNAQPEAALAHLNWLTNYTTPSEEDARLRQNIASHAAPLSNAQAAKANR
jgi:hypothetical protein